MNNDYYNRYKKDTDQHDHLKRQQFFPGGFPGGVPGGGPGGFPGGVPGGFPGQPGQQGPRMDGQPMQAPPNFTPQLPRMDAQPFGGQPDNRMDRDGRDRDRDRRDMEDFSRRPKDFRGCINQFTFIWLINGNSFWFYPVNVRRPFVEGFRWRNNRWQFDRINMNRILFFRCF